MRRYEVYCDASMNRKRRSAGLGLVILDKKTNTTTELSSIAKLNKNCSFTAELFAMAFACDILVNLGIEPEHVAIMSDCMSLILKINSAAKSEGKNIVINSAWEKINLIKTFGAEFKWVKGHSVNRYNRTADKLAGLAAKSIKRSDWGL